MQIREIKYRNSCQIWGARRGDYEKWCCLGSEAVYSVLDIYQHFYGTTAFIFGDNYTMKMDA